MAENRGLEKLLRQMPAEKAGDDLIPSVHAALEAARRRTRIINGALRAGLASLSAIAAIALVPRLTSLLELLPSDWTTAAVDWWTALETAPTESFESLALQLWAIPTSLAQSIGIEFVLGGLAALFMSWLTFKIILAGQVSRKAVFE